MTQVAGSEFTSRYPVVKLDGGWSTRTYPHLLPENKLTVADNVSYYQDGLVSKRPGNVKYANHGTTGAGVAALSLARFYYGSPKSGHLVAQAGGALYAGNDSTGLFTSIGTGFSTTQPATFAQMRDPDMSSGGAIALTICDGSRVPYAYDGVNLVPYSTAAGMLPNGVQSGTSIKPKYCLNWNQHMVLAGDASDPGALYISDALRPESYTGYVFTATNNVNYIPYYPGGPDGRMGDITGLAIIGTALLIFYTAGVVAAINTGTYGATQYQFQVVSSTIGAFSPRSIVTFETYAVFFGGDRFYATDGSTIEPFVDELPTVYSRGARSAYPPDILNAATVVAVRHDTQYWASYDCTGTGQQTHIVVCDTNSNGGFVFGSLSIGEKQSGGAWSRYLGMPLLAAVECRGPGDSGQLFWSSSAKDQIYQHDVGTFSDDGVAISLEFRSKSLFLDQPINPKTVQGLYVLGVFTTLGAGFEDAFQPYVVLDTSLATAPLVQVNVTAAGSTYGSAKYGTFKFGQVFNVEQFSPKAYPQSPARGLSVACGLTETSSNPFNCIGFVLELTLDPPED